MAGRETQPALGLATCTAIVIGNVVGSGFLIAPSALALYGTTALIGGAVMACGAMCLGMVFARLARIAPASGGPYAYTRMGFGRFTGLRIGPFMPVAIVAFVFSMGTIYGAGATAGMWSLILFLLATPVWVFLRRAHSVPGATPAQANPE